MKTFFLLMIIFTFSSLLLVPNTITARKDPGEYWAVIMENQPIPKAIQGLLGNIANSRNGGKFAKDFSAETSSNFWTYQGNKNVEPNEEERSFNTNGEYLISEDFVVEPSSNLWVYDGNQNVEANKDIKFRENLVKDFSVDMSSNFWVYHGDQNFETKQGN
ncbi:organ-specific protein P4 [Ziziphus jujuba]|uniref:Organ-specific protein P4-like n=2 Tax=Ziziphus jujuba TaxID=326968 RepID=A0A6P4AW36_ZIZJJ|nr:organ-specific protein P4 [Ziziphus jujuba]KAH7521404.1 hypothetical protein FEM48_Zijuj07G0029400 [Ziziphus jujuba var. spinosa]